MQVTNDGGTRSFCLVSVSNIATVVNIHPMETKSKYGILELKTLFLTEIQNVKQVLEDANSSLSKERKDTYQNQRDRMHKKMD